MDPLHRIGQFFRCKKNSEESSVVRRIFQSHQIFHPHPEKICDPKKGIFIFSAILGGALVSTGIVGGMVSEPRTLAA